MGDEYDKLLDGLSAPKTPTAKPGRVFSIVHEGDATNWGLHRLPEIEAEYRKRTGKPLPYGRKGQGSGVGGWQHHNNADVDLTPGTPEAVALEEILRARNIPFRATPLKGRQVNAQGRTISTGDHYHLGPPSGSRRTAVRSIKPQAAQPDEYDKLLDGLTAPPVVADSAPTAPPVVAPPVQPTSNPDGTLTRTFTPGQSYFLQPGQELPQRRARRAGGKVGEPYTPEPVTVTYKPGQGEVVDVPQGMDVVTGRSRRVGPDPEVIRQRAAKRLQLARQRAQARLRPADPFGLMGSLQGAIRRPPVTMADLKQAEDRAGLNSPVNLADLKRADDVNLQSQGQGNLRLADEQAAQQVAQVRNQVRGEMETERQAAASSLPVSVQLPPVSEQEVEAEITRRRDDALSEGESGLAKLLGAVLSNPTPTGNLIPTGLGTSSPMTVSRPVKEGIARSVGGTLSQLGNIVERVGGEPYKQNPLQRAGKVAQAGVQESVQMNPAANKLQAFAEEVVRSGAGLPLELAKLKAGGGLGAANLPLQMAASVDPGDPNQSVGSAVAKGLAYHYGMKGTAPLGRVLNAATWTAIPTIEGRLEGRSWEEALGGAFPMGVLAATGPKGVQAREQLFRERGFEPIVVRDTTGRTASVYVNPETGTYVARRVRNAESRPGREVVDVGSGVFNQITRGGRVGQFTGGRVNVNIGRTKNVAAEPAGLAPPPKQIAGRVEPSERPVAVEPPAPIAPESPVRAPQQPAGVRQDRGLPVSDVEAGRQYLKDLNVSAEGATESDLAKIGQQYRRDLGIPVAPVAPVPEPQIAPSVPEGVGAAPTAPVQPQGESAPIIRHSDPRIDGGEIIGKTGDGRLKVANNEGGVSVVKNPRTQGNRSAAIQRRQENVDNRNPISASQAAPETRASIRPPANGDIRLEEDAAGNIEAQKPQAGVAPPVSPVRSEEAPAPTKQSQTGRPLTVEGYHGTRSTIEEFNPEFLGVGTQAQSAKKAFFFASSKDLASDYADMALPDAALKARQRIAKLETQHKELAKGLVDAESYRRLKPQSDAIQAEIAKEKKIVGEALLARGRREELGGLKGDKDVNVLSREISFKNPLVVDFKGRPFREETYNDVIDRAKKEGHDGVVFRNTYDPASSRRADRPTDVYAVFDPKQIQGRKDYAPETTPATTEQEVPTREPFEPEGGWDAYKQRLEKALPRAELELERALRGGRYTEAAIRAKQEVRGIKDGLESVRGYEAQRKPAGRPEVENRIAQTKQRLEAPKAPTRYQQTGERRVIDRSTDELWQFAQKTGGVDNAGMYAGEIRRYLTPRESRHVGIVRKGGMNVEYMMDAANAEGYRDPDSNAPFDNIGRFIQAIAESASGVKSIKRVTGDEHDYEKEYYDQLPQEAKDEFAREMSLLRDPRVVQSLEEVRNGQEDEGLRQFLYDTASGVRPASRARQRNQQQPAFQIHQHVEPRGRGQLSVWRLNGLWQGCLHPAGPSTSQTSPSRKPSQWLPRGHASPRPLSVHEWRLSA